MISGVTEPPVFAKQNSRIPVPGTLGDLACQSLSSPSLGDHAKGGSETRVQAEQLAPPSTQNLAQWGWLRVTSASAAARLSPSSN